MPIPAEIPIRKHFSAERAAEIERYAAKQLEAQIRGLRDIRVDKINRWRKIYLASRAKKPSPSPGRMPQISSFNSAAPSSTNWLPRL